MDFIKNIIRKINEWFDATGFLAMGWVIAATVLFLLGHGWFSGLCAGVFFTKNWSRITDWVKSAGENNNG